MSQPKRGRGPTRKGVLAKIDNGPPVRDLEIYACLQRGETTTATAKKFGLTQPRIVQIGQSVDKWLRPQWMDHILDIRVRHCESLTHLFCEAMAAWERSKLDAVTVTKKAGNKPGEHGGPFDEESTQTRGQAGNPAFLAEARAALADIRKIWAADAPVKHEVSGMAFGGKPLDELRAEYFKRQLAKLEQAKKEQDARIIEVPATEPDA